MSYNFRNEEDVHKFIHYATHGNRRERPVYTNSRGFWSGTDPNGTIDEIFEVQRLHKKEKGIRVRGEVVKVAKNELKKDHEEEQIRQIADGFSDYIFYNGFQTVYSVFPEEDGYEIVYGINSVSFTISGRKYRHNQTTVRAEQQELLNTVISEVTGQEISEPFIRDRLPYYNG